MLLKCPMYSKSPQQHMGRAGHSHPEAHVDLDLGKVENPTGNSTPLTLVGEQKFRRDRVAMTMGVSENVVYPIFPNGFHDQTIPMKNG